MDDDGSSCCLLVTKLGQDMKWTDRKEAYVWASSLLRHIIAKADASWEGELKVVLPLKPTVTGFLYKMVFTNVPDALMENVIVPGIQEQQCTVERVQKDLAAEQRRNSESRMIQIRSRIDAIGNVSKMQQTIGRLMEMRGEGGPETKKRKFSEGAMDVLKTSVKVGAAKLAENREEE